VREIHEELSFYVPPERFDFLTRFEGADPENPEGTVRAVFFIVRGLSVSGLTITEGQLLVVEASELNATRIPVFAYSIARDFVAAFRLYRLQDAVGPLDPHPSTTDMR
jgi:hypothetical protein